MKLDKLFQEREEINLSINNAVNQGKHLYIKTTILYIKIKRKKHIPNILVKLTKVK